MPVWPALSSRIIRFRVKNGAWAPLRVMSMLSLPATGITCILVTVGVPLSIILISSSSFFPFPGFLILL